MKNIYVIHGWGGSNESEGWFKWLQEEADTKGWNLVIPEMPDTNNPTIEKWLEKMKETITESKEVYLIGHSIGAQAIMRYIDKNSIHVNAAIFIAGWFNLLETAYEEDPETEKKIAKPWFETPINYQHVKDKTKHILALFSTDDDCVPVSDAELFKERLGAKIIIKENEGHFNETARIPEILEEIE